MIEATLATRASAARAELERWKDDLAGALAARFSADDLPAPWHAVEARFAADFAPHICLDDIIGSEVLGWGLVRTETLAQGGTRCDFRFKRGGATDVQVRLPVAR